MTARPSPADRLSVPNAVLSRSDLKDLGYPERAVDAIFRALATIHLPGYSRPLIRVEDFNAYLNEHTFNGDRVRP